MTHIVVDDHQAKLIDEAADTVEVRDSAGRRIGYVARDFSPEDIAEAKRRLASDQPCYTTAQVLDYLLRLE